MNWLLGFVMGLLLALATTELWMSQEEGDCQQESAERFADVIEAYKQGSKDLLRLNPIDARLESTCIQIWGMKQND
jgi:hypothetical protein